MVYPFIELRLKNLVIYDNQIRVDGWTRLIFIAQLRVIQVNIRSFIVETCVDLFSYRLTNNVRFSPLTAISILSQFSLCSHTKFISALKNEEARIRFEERSYSKEVG